MIVAAGLAAAAAVAFDTGAARAPSTFSSIAPPTASPAAPRSAARADARTAASVVFARTDGDRLGAHDRAPRIVNTSAIDDATKLAAIPARTPERVRRRTPRLASPAPSHSGGKL